MIEAFTSQRYHYRYQWPGYGPLQMMTPLTCQMSLKMKILSSFICYRYVWCQVKKKLKSEKRKNTTWHLVYLEYINFTKMFYNDIELSGLDSGLTLVLVTIWSVSSLSLSLSPSLWASLNLLTSHVSCEPSPVYIYLQSATLPFLNHGHHNSIWPAFPELLSEPKL